MKSLLPPILERIISMPGLRRYAALRLNKTLRKHQDRIPTDLAPALEAIVVHDLIGNINLDAKGKGDFRFALTNSWFNQRLTAVQMRLDGKIVPPSHLQVSDGKNQIEAASIRSLAFNPGVPLILTVPGRSLADGLHFVDIELTGEIAPIYALSLPVRMQGGRGILAVLTDPPDPELTEKIEPEAKGTVHFVPHIHFDLEWLRDRQTFSRLAVGNLLEALHILETEPETTFVIDQVPQMEALAKASPEALERLKAFVAAGRIEPLMGFYAEPDANLIGGESLVRQTIYWQRYCEKTFGRISKVGWLPDSFGMPASLPQILRKAGCEAFAFTRGVHDRSTPSAFMWEGIDGTRIKTHWMHEMYFAGYPLPDDRHRADYKLSRVFGKLVERAPTEQLMCPAGIDHGRPQVGVGNILRGYNDRHPNIRFEHSLPEKFFSSLPDRGLPVVKGEFNPDNAGTYAARPLIKQLHRKAETVLHDLERLCVITGNSSPHELLDELWTSLFQAQFHDSLPGCQPDSVSTQVEYRLRRIIDLATSTTTKQLENLAQSLKLPPNAGHPLVVANTLPFQREEIFTLELHTDRNGILPLLTNGKRLFDYQVIRSDFFANGMLKCATVVVSLPVPALGYRTLWLTKDRSNLAPAEERAAVSVHENVMRNGWLDVHLDPATGTISQVIDHQRKQTHNLGTAGFLSSVCDKGTLYLTSRPRRGKVTRFIPQRMEIVENGPVRAAIRFVGDIAGQEAIVTYYLSRASKAIDVETNIDVSKKQQSLEVRLPLQPNVKAIAHEIPYGELIRDSLEYPALNYVDINVNECGLALLNAGTAGHRIENDELVMCLARTVDKIHLHEAGPGALSLGRHTFRYGFFPHQGDSRQAHVYRRGLAFNSPLLVHQSAHFASGELPQAQSLLRISPDSIEVGALYEDTDGTLVLRLIERAGKDTAATIKPSWKRHKVEVTDFLGKPVREIKPPRWGKDKELLALDFRAYEIKTLKFS